MTSTDFTSVSPADLYRYQDPKKRRAVERAIEYMTENLWLDVRVDDIAKVMGYSKFHANRVFQGMAGVTPGRYLARLRMAKAAELLKTTNYSVTKICHKVGYTSVGTFSTLFSKHYGVSPTLYAGSRCGCGLFDGRDHAYSAYCEKIRGRYKRRPDEPPPEPALCQFCHKCLAELALIGVADTAGHARAKLLSADPTVEAGH